MALKIFMCTLYGYTGAVYALGRMSAIEIADTIAKTANEILQQTINIINQHKIWNAKVVYGDTDSVFVHVRGRSLEEAFKLGNEMQKEITSNFPHPIEIKFEKVYLPLLMTSKKRYVGLRYDNVTEQP